MIVAINNKHRWLAWIVVFFGTGVTPPLATAQEAKHPVRNDVALVRDHEFLVLRHQYLKKGSHEKFYELSRDGVWPFFEKIGSRVVGQWQVIHPQGGGTEERDEGYRLARYVNYEHWKDTRTSQTIGGNGPDHAKFREAVRTRNQYRLGSKHVYFLQGPMAPGGPYYMPGLDEKFEFVDDGDADRVSDDQVRPVRNDTAQPGREIVTLRYWRIQKDSFDRFHQASVRGVWPFFEKIGARIIGQWKVVYPEESVQEENPEFDEVVMLTRYASYDHWRATRKPAQLGGNGPDYRRLQEALRRRRSVTIDTNVTFLQGHMYQSPPNFLPGLPESYQSRSR